MSFFITRIWYDLANFLTAKIVAAFCFIVIRLDILFVR